MDRSLNCVWISSQVSTLATNSVMFILVGSSAQMTQTLPEEVPSCR
jgi:glycine cleavage system regulatory protein